MSFANAIKICPLITIAIETMGNASAFLESSERIVIAVLNTLCLLQNRKLLNITGQPSLIMRKDVSLVIPF